MLFFRDKMAGAMKVESKLLVKIKMKWLQSVVLLALLFYP